MAYIPDATDEQIDAGGRTVEEIMEAEKASAQRNPGPVRKLALQMKSRGIASARASAMSAFRSYFGQLTEAASESGVDTEVTDEMLAEELGSFLDGVMGEAEDVSLNGLTAEEKVDIANKELEESAPSHSTYVPDDRSAGNMWRSQSAALESGSAAKTLSYTEDQLRNMSPDDLQRASALGMIDPAMMEKMGIDPASVQNNGLQFGVATAPEVQNVPKIKVLPDYMPGFSEGKDSSVVESMSDMLHKGNDEIFTAPVSKVKDVIEKGVEEATGVPVEGAFDALSKLRGQQADSELNVDGITANEDNPFFNSDGYGYPG